MDLGEALAPLAALRRFVNYETYPDPDNPGKTIKRPMDVATGKWCNSNLPEHQYTFEQANATGRKVGFVFTEGDGYFFIDIDSCLISSPTGKHWSPFAIDICQRFPGAAVEVSQSGTGLHVIGRGKPPAHSNKNALHHFELYTHERFCALTGTGLTGNAATDLGEAVTKLAEEYFPPNAHGEIADWTSEPSPLWDGHLDDEELINHALSAAGRSAAGAFGGGVTFADLWHADADKLGAKWPSDKGPYGASEADAALASQLAFWTGGNHERIKTLMQQSALVRPKWEEREQGYLDLTIMRAASVVSNVHQKRKPLAGPGVVAGVPQSPMPEGDKQPEPAVPAPEIMTGAMVTVAASMVQRAAGREYIPIGDQTTYFTGCVYVTREDKIWIPTTGHMLSKSRFDVIYGGHLFPLDTQNEKTTDSAWDAFTKSRVLQAPYAWKTCFRPEYAPGQITVEEGQSLLNTYLPIQTLRRAGDAGPFLRHMELLFPHPRDRQIILTYMASCIRNPGLKAQWCPVIQGAEGNGKSLLNRLMQHCIGRRMSHLVNPEAMAKTGNQFNSWILDKLFVGIEEIFLGGTKRDMLEVIKTLVTDDWIGVEGKGSNQETGDNRANLLMFTNHRDAIPVTVDMRRYSIFYTAQQSYADIVRDGMTGRYFPDLYDWFYGRGEWASEGPWYGASVINDYLRNMPLEAELDPAQLAQRAPETSSTLLARSLSMGKAEQEVQEAAAEGRPGFAGGWVGSIMLDKLLDQIRAPVPRSKRRAMMESLGYMMHPGLPDGRTHNKVQPDDGKPRLYVRVGHLSLGLTEPAAIAKAYAKAQQERANEDIAERFAK